MTTRAPRSGPRVAAAKKRRAAQQVAARKRVRTGRDPTENAEAAETTEQNFETLAVLEQEESALEDLPPGFEGEADEAQIADPQLRLRFHSVRGYVAALTDLWNHQSVLGLNDRPSPRSMALKALTNSVKNLQFAQERNEFADRGAGTIRDGYTPAHIPRMTDKIWGRELKAKLSSVEPGHRTIVDFLFGHAMLMRLSNRILMQLPDLHLVRLPKENSLGTGWCMVCILKQGKSSTLRPQPRSA